MWLQAWLLRPLHLNFDPADVEPWDVGRFTLVRKIQDARRNKGHVNQMHDTVTGEQVAVKRLPNAWACKNHEVFASKHPRETERPWVDIGCAAFLNSIGYPYACPLLGVFRGAEATSIVSELASEGDLFGWMASCDEEPGPGREALARPLARHTMDAVRLLHELSIVHRDISPENFLLSRWPGNGALRVQLIDFGMATTERYTRGNKHGKPSYQAPEVHAGKVVDGFLSDAFSVGVVLYCLLMKEYPWLSTKPGACAAFSLFRTRGFRKLMTRRALRDQKPILQHLSEPLTRLLEGLLMVDPGSRLTLGEASAFAPSRRSARLEPWVRGDRGSHYF